MTTIARDDNIIGLQVAVYHLLTMNIAQGRNQLLQHSRPTTL